MPRYVYLLDGAAKNSNGTIPPDEMLEISDTFIRVETPMINPVYADGIFREKTVAELEQDAKDTKLARHVFTRLQIRGAFISMGMEPTLDLLLANNPRFDRYWFEAQEIDTNHEVTQQAMSMFSAEEQEALILAID